MSENFYTRLSRKKSTKNISTTISSIDRYGMTLPIVPKILNRDFLREHHTTKHLIMSDGERYKLLVDANTGIPIYYPTLYATSQVRGNSMSVSTIQSFILSIKALFKWLDENSIDIENRFKNGELLTLMEIESLRDHFKLPLQTKKATESNLVAIKRTVEGARMSVSKKTPGVYSHTQYIRMTFVANYLKWLAEILNQKQTAKTDKININSMYKRIKAHRPKIKGRSERDRDDKGLDPNLVDQVMDALKPGSKDNPFRDTDVQIRNALIMALLRFLGIRRGELLNLKVEDINFFSNEVTIYRRPDSLSDPRPQQPLVKTLERTLPITEKLAENLNEYARNIRPKFPQAKYHPYFFVTHKAGPHQGKPLSNSGFGKMMLELQGLSQLFRDVHAHALRHSWNYTFSTLMDKSSDKISPEKEEQMRSYLMGWAEGSGTAATYNRRHIKEKAKEAILNYQNGMIKGDLLLNDEK